MRNMAKEYKSLGTKGERLAFVEKAIAEEQERFNATRKRVEPHDPEYNGQNDLYVCHQFALGAMASFNPKTRNQVHPEYLGALKPLNILDTNQIPLKYTTISGARGAFVEEPFGEDWQRNEMDHCINAVQVGDSGKSIDDWVFVEPQGLEISQRDKNSGIRYSELPTILSIAKSVGHKRKYKGEDKWFYGDYLDSRVQFGSHGERVEEEFLQAYRANPINVTGYTAGPLLDLFSAGTERWLAKDGKLEKFKEDSAKIRIGKPTKGYNRHPDHSFYFGEDGTIWYDVPQRKLVEHVKAFVELGVVSHDNLNFLKRITSDSKLHEAFDAGMRTHANKEAIFHLMEHAS